MVSFLQDGMTTRWDDYKEATKITSKDLVIQLLECCEKDLRKDLTRAAGGSLTNKPEDEVRQDHDEAIDHARHLTWRSTTQTRSSVMCLSGVLQTMTSN